MTPPSMQPDQPATEVPPTRDSSTVVLLRDGTDDTAGVEVLLLRRHVRSKAFGGAFVFPGGTVDDADRNLDPACWTTADLPAWQTQLEVPDESAALGFLVAAIRETFEEAGVLLANHRDGTPISAQALTSDTFVTARHRLASRSERWDWSAWLEQEQLALDLDALVLWSWWVTPVHRPHRFDTRFFAAALPNGQWATHDQVETTAMRWLSADDALEAHAEGEVHLRDATVSNLRTVARYATVGDALAAARRGEIDRRRVQPRVIATDDGYRSEYSIGGAPQTTLP